MDLCAAFLYFVVFVNLFIPGHFVAFIHAIFFNNGKNRLGCNMFLA